MKEVPLQTSFRDATARLEDPFPAYKGNLYTADMNLTTADTNLTAIVNDHVSSMKLALEKWKGHLAMQPNIIREATYPTPLVLSPLFPFLLLSLARQKNSPNTKKHFAPRYDFIVVGAGSAGSVIASRLSELHCITVLLLEAGKSPPLQTDVPATAGIYFNSDIDWRFKTVPQKHAAYAHKNRQVTFLKGKVIGGSSVTNNMFWNRGHKKNYDSWARNGAKGWNWRRVLPFFMKAENVTEPDIVRHGQHGVKGPMTISRLWLEPVFKDVYKELAESLHYPITDASGHGQIGMVTMLGNVRENQRCSTAKAYLVPAEDRPNLDIVKEAYVRKILIKDRKACGVEFDYKGKTHQVTVRKEVIVCAGAINTPKLLMLSGIGPKETLNKYGIKVLSDLPVGKNLQDHPATVLNFKANPLKVPRYLVQVLNSLNVWQYIRHRTGPLAESTGFYSISFFANDGRKDQEKVADTEVYFLKGVQEFFQMRFNMDPLVYAKLYGPHLLDTMVHCVAECSHAQSKGEVTIQSADPYAEPLIDPKYYTHPQDEKDIVTGMKMCLKMASTPAMKKFGLRLSSSLMPGCEESASDIDKYLECYAKNFVVSECHDVGTAKMGDPSDPTTVVDPHLRVKGINGLRVADASIMPTIPDANTNSPTVMIGEKAAYIIKKTVMCPKKV